MKPEDVPDEVMRAFVDGAIGSPPDVKANSPEWVRNGLARALAAYEAAGLAEIEAQRQRAEQAEQMLREEVAAMAEERIAVGHANILGLIRQRDEALRELAAAHEAWTAVREESATLIAEYSEPGTSPETTAARAMAKTARRYQRERDEALAAVQRVRDVHNGGSAENAVLCVACCAVLPCPTLTALDQPEETPDA